MKNRDRFLSFFGSGNVDTAPGTAGTIFALIPAYILYQISPLLMLVVTIALFFLAIVRIDEYEKRTKTHDSSTIVIDEVVGIFVTILIAGSVGIVSLILSFIAFRYFDIVKPGIIGEIDENVSGGTGVMLDDVMAGIFAGILVRIINIIFL